MRTQYPMILVTGATGQLGRLVIAELLKRVPPAHIAALVRNRESARDLEALGIHVREGDYDKPPTLADAFAGIDRLLLISSSENGKRIRQHGNVIEAAKQADISLLAYTSVLHASTSQMDVAAEHRGTEALLRWADVPHVILRNGWYTENYIGNIHAAIREGVMIGGAGDGRIASAARSDFAAAAAAVLLAEQRHAGTIYELAGDEAYNLSELAEEIARQSGEEVCYFDMSEHEYCNALMREGLPQPLAALISNSDAMAAKGALFDDRRQLSALIGKPTKSMAQCVAEAIHTMMPVKSPLHQARQN